MTASFTEGYSRPEPREITTIRDQRSITDKPTIRVTRPEEDVWTDKTPPGTDKGRLQGYIKQARNILVLPIDMSDLEREEN